MPPEIIVAIWGLVFDYGKGDIGKMPVVRTLATMAHDCRRTELFQGELLAAPKIVQRGDLPLREMIGAFAGEIGQTQFLPSSYIKYGVDFDGDGHVDLRRIGSRTCWPPPRICCTSPRGNGAPYKRGHAEVRGDARVEPGHDLSQDDRLFRRSVGGAVGHPRSIVAVPPVSPSRRRSAAVRRVDEAICRLARCRGLAWGIVAKRQSKELAPNRCTCMQTGNRGS